MKTATWEAYQLIHAGALAFSQVEADGVKVDIPYLRQKNQEILEEIRTLEDQIKASETWVVWCKLHSTPNPGSRVQLVATLAHMGIHIPSGDEDALMRVRDEWPLADTYRQYQKRIKLRSTYLKGIYDASDADGFVHASFNLHTTTSYRSSLSDPNLQNVPIRDKYIGGIIRSAFIPRHPDHVILEADFKAIEVCVAACYHKDPTMLRYIEEGYDMHRDMALECYKLAPDELTKDARQFAKNQFVFPEFYGDYYCGVARGLWDSILLYNLKTAHGVGLYDHLVGKGITSLGLCDPKQPLAAGTYEAYIKAVEDRFWGQRFPVYAKWRRDWFGAYLKDGGFDTLTGFRIDGVMRRNEVINLPVQGSAFHCLLWSLIEIQKVLNKGKWRSKIVLQIHDSIIADVHKGEVADFLALANEIMTVAIRKHWPWIITPLTVEFEACQPGGNWHGKKVVHLN